MYVDKLDGLVDAAFFDKTSGTGGVMSRTAASARSTGINPPSSPTWTRVCRFYELQRNA